MYVPNFIPEALEIPGSVTQQPYRARVRFIKRVNAYHALSVLAVVFLAIQPLPDVGVAMSLIVLALCLLVLSAVRTLERGRTKEALISTLLIPAALLGVALVVRSLQAAGFPVWATSAGVSGALLYSLLCGRDFSFVGQYMLALIASSVGLAAWAVHLELDGPQAAMALGWNALFLSYLVYDTASLLARRRIGEEWAAVADLYRDVFNFLGFGIQMVRHWRRHKIF
jgi:FtsH-binding integral membrane protein